MSSPSRVAAERALQDRSGRTWTLRIFEPVADPDDEVGECRCRFDLLDPDGVTAFAATPVSIDRLQALTFALAVAGDVLPGRPEGLTFLGQDDLGLPRTVSREGGRWRVAMAFPVDESEAGSDRE